jgi:FkbM family methyltransferase
MNIENFDWGTSNDWYKETIGREIFKNNLYHKFFEVEEGDVVLDLGASIGPYTFSILDKNPKHVFCLEPSFEEFPTLVLNTRMGSVTCINKGISNQVGEIYFDVLYGKENKAGVAYSTTFKKIISDYNLHKIDFIKTDCEGGEYDVFNFDNLIWIKQNVKKIVGEWHLETTEKKEKFRLFRDVYLRLFPNHQVFSVDNADIKWELWTENFINYYNQVIIHIDNRD